MGKRISKNNSVVPIDNSLNELFDSLDSTESKQMTLSYIPSFFTTASLPFKNINRTEFIRKASNGISLLLNSPKNVPYGKYGRLLLSVFTTHAVLSKEKRVPVVIEFDSMSQLLREIQLPRQRGKDIQEQLECFTRATFSFEQKIEEQKIEEQKIEEQKIEEQKIEEQKIEEQKIEEQKIEEQKIEEQKIEEQKQAYLFKNLYELNEKIPKKDITVRTTSTGTILFTEGVQYQEIIDESSKSQRVGNFKIILSANFAAFCQQHAVPINYTVYKDITSSVGKDIYAWLVYRNNGLTEGKPVFVPRDKLVEQFMPVAEESDPKIANVNYSRIIDQIKEIKKKYYPELNIDIDKSGTGVTLFKSPTPVLQGDARYALISNPDL